MAHYAIFKDILASNGTRGSSIYSDHLPDYISPSTTGVIADGTLRLCTAIVGGAGQFSESRSARAAMPLVSLPVACPA